MAVNDDDTTDWQGQGDWGRPGKTEAPGDEGFRPYLLEQLNKRFELIAPGMFDPLAWPPVEPPPPPPFRTLSGISCYRLSEVALIESQISTLVGREMHFESQRSFKQTTGPYDVNLWPNVVEDKLYGRESALSWKVYPTFEQLDMILESLGDHPASLNFFHEATNPSKGIDPVRHNEELQRIFGYIKAQGVPNAKTEQTFMNYDFDPTYRTPRIEEGWLVPATLELTDIVAQDAYNPYGYDPDGDGKGSERWLEMPTMLAWADEYLEPWGFLEPGRSAINECASPEIGGDKPAWVRNTITEARRRKMRRVIYYDVEEGEIACTSGHRGASSIGSLIALSEWLTT